MRLLKEIRNLMGNYHVKSGIYHYYRNEFKQAIDFLRKALRDEPSLTPSDRRNARYYLTMTFMTSAERLEEQGDLEAAATDFETAADTSPSYPDIRYRLGRVLERMGRTDEAIEQYRLAVACQQDYLEAQVALGFALLAAGRGAEAGPAMERALELKIGRIQEPFREALAKIEAGAREEAAGLFRQALLSEPGRFGELFRSAIEHLKAEEYAKALVDLEAGLELNPRYPDLHNYRGIALCEVDRAEESIEAFRAAVALKPESMVPRLNLAFAQLRAGNPKEAEAELQAVLERDPSEPAARAKLEELQTGRTPERRPKAARRASS